MKQDRKLPEVAWDGGELTKEHALFLTWQLWEWLKGGKGKLSWPGWAMMGGKVSDTKAQCPCCQYVKSAGLDESLHRCAKGCPLGHLWPDGCEHSSAAFKLWERSEHSIDRAFYAKQIAEAAEKGYWAERDKREAEEKKAYEPRVGDDVKLNRDGFQGGHGYKVTWRRDMSKTVMIQYKTDLPFGVEANELTLISRPEIEEHVFEGVSIWLTEGNDGKTWYSPTNKEFNADGFRTMLKHLHCSGKYTMILRRETGKK